MRQKYLEDNAEKFQLLLEDIYKKDGFDFRNYSWNMLKRRINLFMCYEQIKTIVHLQELLLRDSHIRDKFLRLFSINTTSMFRNPDFYLTLRKKVFPILRTYPTVRIWVAGCATGEEAYSLAILLKEENLYSRSIIYATDIDETCLKRAKEGIFSLSKYDNYNHNYLQAGGDETLNHHYVTDGLHYKIKDNIKKNIIFSLHNLVTDGSFNEFNLVMCRNVLIYFNQSLKNRVYRLLNESTRVFGALALGNKESLLFSPIEKLYNAIDNDQKIYKKIKE